MKFAPEGYPFIIFFSALSAVALCFGPAWALAPLVLTLFMFYFFRDPERIAPAGDNIFTSPADGKIIRIKESTEDGYLKGNATEISIFMSPLDVHVNRAPCDGVVEYVIHTPGKFMSAFREEASLLNENIAMGLNSKLGRILVRQVAGFVARRAVCRVNPGDALKKGERYGLIKFSSRLDVYLPVNTVIKVGIGDKVKAGVTVLGEV